jgi:hypothetical protein
VIISLPVFLLRGGGFAGVDQPWSMIAAESRFHT